MRRRVRGWPALCAVPWLVACSPPEPESGNDAPAPPAANGGSIEEFAADRNLPLLTGDLPLIRKRRFIRALVSFDRTNFYFRGSQFSGIEYELLREYEKHLNAGRSRQERQIDLYYLPLPFERLLPALQQGLGDIAAAGLTATAERGEVVAFSAPYIPNVRELFVGHSGSRPVASLQDLAGRTVHVARSTSHLEHLRGLSGRLAAAGLPPIDIRLADSHLHVQDLLEMVDAGILEYAVSDGHLARAWTGTLINLVLFEEAPLHTGGRIGWAVRQDNPELLADINAFMRAHRKGTQIGNILYRRYFKREDRLGNPVSSETRERLAELTALFREFGDRYGFDWRRLVAQAYQESRLDQSRVSTAGAVGIMQVRPSTASDPNVGIGNIHELRNNVHAGVKYLAFLRDRYFNGPDIAADERMHFAQAAYNAGPRRVMRMRREAESMELDPNRWFDHVELAALRLVGRETVRYVANIEKYYLAVKLWYEAQEQRRETRRNLLTAGDGTDGQGAPAVYSPALDSTGL